MANRDYVLSATLELKDKLTGKLNDARKGLEGVKGSAAAASGALDGVGTSAVKAAADTGKLKSALSSVKGNYQATVGVKDEASGRLGVIKSSVKELAGRASAVTVRARDEASGKITHIKEELSGVKGSYQATLSVKAAADTGGLKSALSGVKGNYSATLSVKDMASPTIRKVNREIRDISIHGNNTTLTVTAEDKVSPALSKAKSGLQSVKGNYSATLSVKDMASGKLNAIKSSVRELAGRASAVTVRARDEVSGKITHIKEELAGLTGKTYTAMVFQSTPLIRGATISVIINGTETEYFNPRPSYEERRRCWTIISSPI